MEPGWYLRARELVEGPGRPHGSDPSRKRTAEPGSHLSAAIQAGCSRGRSRRSRTSLKIAALFLFRFNRFEKGLEIALSETLRAMALNDFDEHGRTALDGFREDLQQIAFIVPIDQDTQLVNGPQVLIDLSDTLG